MQIVAAANPQYHPLFHFLADTGTRIGEAIWLTWDDVDFENGVIRVQAKDGWAPKSGDERTIPISPQLRNTLLALPRVSSWVFVAKPTETYPQTDRQVSDRRALDHLKRVLRRLGLRGHLHTFRHSFISYALTSGTPESVVRRWVGHVDQKIMARYTHIADRVSQRAMEDLFGSAGQAGDSHGSSTVNNQS